MKRMLILLALLPVILLAQQQGHDAIDSNQDIAINLQSMAASMSNDQCTKVAEIRTTDNGEYITTVVFLHSITEPDTAIKANTEPDTPANKEITETVAPANKENTETVTPPDKEITKTVAPANKENTEPAPPRPDEIRTPVDSMHLSPDGYSLLQKLEGYSPSLYMLGDGGYTIGFGFFVPYNEGYKWRNGITWEGAENMIKQKMPAYEAQVKEYVNVPLTQNEFDALTMLAYNLGGFSKATSIINDINNQVDFDILQRDWKRFIHSKAPNVAKGLMNRRKDELGVRKLSDYQPDRKIQVLKK
jgi:GH24 family phage-related lysozyme (muramidase)